MKINFKPSNMLNPVPAILVTTRNKDGQDNVFTVSWTGTICSNPPMLYISVTKQRNSFKNLMENPFFIVNLPPKSLVRTVDYCGVIGADKKDKIKERKLTLVESEKINCAYIDDCPINIECEVIEVKELGSHFMFIAKIVNNLVDEELIDDNNKIDFKKADLMVASHGEYFSLNKNAIGKFGYSISKKKKVISSYKNKNYL